MNRQSFFEDHCGTLLIASALFAGCGGAGLSQPPEDLGPQNPPTDLIAPVRDSGTPDLFSQEAACHDGILDGNESDVDCGGCCGACQNGKRCRAATDCEPASACVSGACAPPPVCHGCTFSLDPAVSYSAGMEPEGAALADLDGDGLPDVIVWGTGGIAMLRGKGDGTFLAATLVAPNFGDTAFGDFDRDCLLDVAVTSGSGVDVLRGTGQGQLQPGPSYALPGSQRLIATDLNGDGALDLVVSGNDGNGGGWFATLMGRGDGTFIASPEQPLDGPPDQVAAVDLRGKGLMDVVMIYRDNKVLAAFYDLLVLLGDGTGAFPVRQNMTLMDEVEPFAFGDVNGDGATDLIGADRQNVGVELLLGNGDGSFRSPMFVDLQRSLVAGGPEGLLVADLDGDGMLDVASAVRDQYNQPAGNTVSVVLGNGDGTFRMEQRFGAVLGVPAQFILAQDLDGDGRKDIVVGDRINNAIGVLINGTR